MSTLMTTLVYLPLGLIHVNREERQRQTIDTENLEDSIRTLGVLNPIIVRLGPEGEIILVAGERRLQACKNLGHETIPARYTADLSPIEYQIIELEENSKRKDLSWQEHVAATARIHQLHKELDPKWNAVKTAASLGVHSSVVGDHVKLTERLSDPRVAQCKTITEALVMIERSESRQRGNDLSIFLGTPTISPKQEAREASESMPIINQSFLEWATTYEGEPFNLIHCDFPYGIGVADGPVGLGFEHTFYQDTPEAASQLLDCFVTNINRYFAIHGHIMFWYSDKNRDEVYRQLQRIPNMLWIPHPLIWVHAESGITPDYRRRPKHVYDTCLLGTRNRHIVQVLSDVYQCANDTTLHPSTKPEEMLHYFMSMLVDQHTHMLDPTCGSGSSIRVAEHLGASRVLGLEIDPDYCSAAQTALREARRLRNISL